MSSIELAAKLAQIIRQARLESGPGHEEVHFNYERKIEAFLQVSTRALDGRKLMIWREGARPLGNVQFNKF